MKKYAILLLSVLLMGCFKPADTPDDASETIVSEARAKLADYLKTAPSNLTFISVEEKTWANSGLGCFNSRGVKHIITSGHLIKFEKDGYRYNIHEGRNKYILCLTDKAELL